MAAVRNAAVILDKILSAGPGSEVPEAGNVLYNAFVLGDFGEGDGFC